MKRIGLQIEYLFGLRTKAVDGSYNINEYDGHEHFTGQYGWMLIYDKELNLMRAYQSDDNYYHWSGYWFKVFLPCHENSLDIPNTDDVEAVILPDQYVFPEITEKGIGYYRMFKDMREDEFFELKEKTLSGNFFGQRVNMQTSLQDRKSNVPTK